MPRQWTHPLDVCRTWDWMGRGRPPVPLGRSSCTERAGVAPPHPTRGRPSLPPAPPPPLQHKRTLNNNKTTLIAHRNKPLQHKTLSSAHNNKPLEDKNNTRLCTQIKSFTEGCSHTNARGFFHQTLFLSPICFVRADCEGAQVRLPGCGASWEDEGHRLWRASLQQSRRDR